MRLPPTSATGCRSTEARVNKECLKRKENGFNFDVVLRKCILVILLRYIFYERDITLAVRGAPKGN